MAKTIKKVESPSMMDFSEENLLDDNYNDELEEDQEEVIEEEVEEEAEEPKKVIKKKAPLPPKKKVEEPIVEEEEEIESAAAPDEGDEEVEDETNDPLAFWQEVDNITGFPVDVDYGDLDPISPQGVALREKALMEKSVADFIDRVAEQHPSAYKALEYALAGGNIEELFRGDKDYSRIVLKEDDEDHAKLILAEFYEKKGITNPDRIRRMISADAESEEGVVTAAQSALDEMKQAQEQEKQEEVRAQQARADRQKAQDQQFLRSVDTLISSMKLDSFRISSRKDADEFSTFVRQHVQRDGKGGYLFVTPVEPTTLEKQLQAEFFKFKKGNLDSLIQIKATTQHAQRLRLGAEKEAAERKRTSGNTAPRSTGSMKDYEV